MANTTFPFKYRNSYEFFCKVKYNFYKWSFSIKRKLTRKFLRIMILKICLRCYSDYAWIWNFADWSYAEILKLGNSSLDQLEDAINYYGHSQNYFNAKLHFKKKKKKESFKSLNKQLHIFYPMPFQMLQISKYVQTLITAYNYSEPKYPQFLQLYYHLTALPAYQSHHLQKFLVFQL